MNPFVGETKNPFVRAKVVAANVNPEDYHRQLDGIQRGNPDYVQSRSDLMAFRSCPAKWLNGWQPKDTDATDYGSLQDCRVLMPHRFEILYIQQPKTCPATKSMECVRNGEAEVGDEVDWSPTSKFAQDWKREQRKSGRIILDAQEEGESTLALGILFADKRISTLINCSQKQVFVVAEYEDKETRIVVPVKSLIDLVPAADSEYKKAVADFKTARSAHPRSWVRAVDERDYDAQAAMCLDIYTAATGEDRCEFLHVIQENTHPWQPARRMLTLDFIELGRQKIIGALKRYCLCLKENRWPDWDDDSPYNGWGEVAPEAWMLTR